MEIDYSKELNKTYKHKIYSPFLKALKTYNLIEENDKIAVCVSGGKDSFLMALCFKELINYSDIPFSVEYIMMNPGYKENDLISIKENALKLGIDLHIFDTKIYKISSNQEKNKCYICAKMRRGALYNEAQKLGCNKIALAHHSDDVIETLLMSILYSGEISGMRPILKSANYDGMKLIRPMYFVKEKDIIDFSNEYNLNFLKCACFLTENEMLCEASKRQIVKKFLNSIDSDSDLIKKNILTSMDNVNLNKLNSYKINDEVINLLDKE